MSAAERLATMSRQLTAMVISGAFDAAAPSVKDEMDALARDIRSLSVEVSLGLDEIAAGAGSTWT